MLGRTNIGRTPNLTTLTVTPTTSTQNFTPGSSYDGYSEVTVRRIPYASYTWTKENVSVSSGTRLIIPNTPGFTEIEGWAIYDDSARASLSGSDSDPYKIIYASKPQYSTIAFAVNQASSNVIDIKYPNISLSIIDQKIYIDIIGASSISEVMFNTSSNQDYIITIYGKTS